jgi:hypothetical protein
MSEVVNYVANTAFSLTLAGNSGISPFLTMALIGLAGKIQPEYLNLNNTMKWIMTSWPSLCFWCAMTVLETVGKCVPIIDQIMDTAEAFIVPVLVSALLIGMGLIFSFPCSSRSLTSSHPDASISIFAAKSTLGTFSAFGSFDSYGDGQGAKQGASAVARLRGLTTVSDSSVAHGMAVFVKVILVFVGIVLAISIHFCKMLVRLLGEGCLTQIITILEVTTVCVSVLVSIFIRQFAIFVASCLLLAAGYNAKKRWDKRREGEGQQQQQQQEQQQQQQPGTIAEGYDSEISTPFIRASDKAEGEGTTQC